MGSSKDCKDASVVFSILCNALELQQQASNMGFEWVEVEGILDKIREEVGEIEKEIQIQNYKKIKKEIGDLYLVCLHLSQYLKVDPIECLHISCETFRRRWEKVQTMITVLPEGSKERIEYLDQLWNQVKCEEESDNLIL
ncbi:MAG TPA: MazG nucleotide pyrophosphohydrolase domain-containing protein [Candidatus Hydrogenedens sp.]|nr:MazG nucleotide pyrophosphohydrolase domain-containing protein [Candidatus Hydrogenedens sp.]